MTQIATHISMSINNYIFTKVCVWQGLFSPKSIEFP
jgi:hypothetical protein